MRPPSPISAAALADAAMRLGVPFRVAPAAMRRLEPGALVIGWAVPCRHSGSVDVILEAIGRAPAGAVLVIDNDGRTDEGCIGDLVTLEAERAGIGGIVLWGAHRDTAELRRIGLAVWSLGTTPVGPRRVRQRASDVLERARIDDFTVTGDDAVVADDDGVIFVPSVELDALRRSATEIAAVERRQAKAMRGGRTLRDQLAFDRYLEHRRTDPEYDFRRHLAETGGAIET